MASKAPGEAAFAGDPASPAPKERESEMNGSCGHGAHTPGQGAADPGTVRPAGAGIVTRLVWVLAANLAFFAVEVAGGILANSLALLADAGHMLTDVVALALALVAALLSRQPPTPRRTFGLLRTEVLGAFANGGLLVLMVGFIFWEAWRRFGQPQAVDAPILLAVAVVGLLVNAGSAWNPCGGRPAQPQRPRGVPAHDRRHPGFRRRAGGRRGDLADGAGRRSTCWSACSSAC